MKNKISKAETVSWTMGFVGTGIGAGILFLPIQAGVSGIVCFLVSCCLAFTFSYVSHKVFAKLLIDTGAPKDFPQIVQNYLGNIFSLITTLLFFLLMLGYLSVYIMGLNVGLSDYLFSLHLVHNTLHDTIWFPLTIISVLAIIISLKEKVIIKIMSFITFPLIILLFFLSIYLIKYWNFDYFFNIPDTKHFFSGVFFNIPILIFAGLFFPPISSMVLSHRHKLRNREKVQFYSYRTIMYAQIILLGFTVFFTFSCLLATPPEILDNSLGSNLNIMAILGKAHKTKSLSIISPLIAVVAILTSFLGYYFGAKESTKNLFAVFLAKRKYEESDINKILDSVKFRFFINLFFCSYLLAVSIINFGVGRFLSLTCTPITALILYIIPCIIFNISRKYKRFRGVTYYILLIGALVLLFSTTIGEIILIL